MARGTTAEERRDAVTIIPASEGQTVPDEDIERAFDNWRASFEEAEEPGKIRAFEIPMDERGTPLPTAKNQVRLGAWAIDIYNFDELCAMLIRDFMQPEGKKVMAVRFLGTAVGERGLRFNKTVILRAPPPGAAQPNNQQQRETTAELMTAISQMNERMMGLVARQAPTPERDPMAEMQRMALFLEGLNKPMMAMLTALIPALVGRAPSAGPGGDPFQALDGALGVVEKLKGLTGGEGEGGGGDGPDWLEAIKAIAPIAKPALEAIPHLAAQAAAARQPGRVIQGQATAVQPGAKPAQPSAPTPVQPANLTDIPTGDQALFAQLKPQIDTLVQMASQGADPVAAADLLFDSVLMQAPDNIYEQALTIIGGPKFLSQVAAFNPEVPKHADFFEKFRAQVLARYEQEDKEAGLEPST